MTLNTAGSGAIKKNRLIDTSRFYNVFVTVGQEDDLYDYVCYYADEDNDVKIQEAIDYVSNRGGGVVMLHGVFKGGQLNIRDGVSLRGEGLGTIYEFVNTDFDPTSDYGVKVTGSDCGIRDMTFDGSARAAGAYGKIRGIDIVAEANDDVRENITIQNLKLIKTSRGVVVDVGSDGYTGTSAKNILVDNIKTENVTQFASVYIWDTSDGTATQTGRNIIYSNIQYLWESEAISGVNELFDFNRCEYVTLKDSYFICDNSLQLDASDEVLDLAGRNNNCNVINVTVKGNFRAFCKMNGRNRYNKVRGCHFEYITGDTTNDYGVQIDNDDAATGDEPIHNIVSDNTVVGCTNGVIVKGAWFNTIANNNFESCARGVLIQKDATGAAKYNKAIGNTVRNPTAEAIKIDDDCMYNDISNNILIDDQGVATMTYGIREVGDADYNVITGNIISGATNQSIAVLGANTVVKSNIPTNISWELRKDLADDASVSLKSGSSGFGFAQIGDNREYALFSWTAAAAVTLIENSANAVDSDTDGKFCIFDDGTSIKIRNRLGSKLTLKYQLTYY
jgi:parallel beta-helix repeat protein